MIELSGYTGNSLECVRSRLIASKEMKSSRPTVTPRKYKVKYSTQTLVMGNGFKVIPSGMVPKKTIETEVSSVDEFEKFVVSMTMGKHKNPQYTKKDGTYTIFSKIGSDNLYVDIIELNSKN